MLYHRESRNGGLLAAAAEARRRAATERATGDHHAAKFRDEAAARAYGSAELLTDLAAWCELEADTYVGASIALTSGQ